MSTPTAQELKDEVNDRFIDGEGNFSGTHLKELFDLYADTINAKKQGYRYFRGIVFSERFSTTESVDNQTPVDKFVELDNLDFGAVTVERVSVGQFKVTTSYNDGATSNLLDNGSIKIQILQDISTNNVLRSGDTTFVGSAITIAHKVTFVSPGVFDVYISSARDSENENLVDCAFYLNIELFNMPTV